MRPFSSKDTFVINVGINGFGRIGRNFFRASPCLVCCKNGKPQDVPEYWSADNFEDLP